MKKNLIIALIATTVVLSSIGYVLATTTLNKDLIVDADVVEKFSSHVDYLDLINKEIASEKGAIKLDAIFEISRITIQDTIELVKLEVKEYSSKYLQESIGVNGELKHDLDLVSSLKDNNSKQCSKALKEYNKNADDLKIDIYLNNYQYDKVKKELTENNPSSSVWEIMAIEEATRQLISLREREPSPWFGSWDETFKESKMKLAKKKNTYDRCLKSYNLIRQSISFFSEKKTVIEKLEALNTPDVMLNRLVSMTYSTGHNKFNYEGESYTALGTSHWENGEEVVTIINTDKTSNTLYMNE